MSTPSGAACPVCGGTCRGWPDLEHRADYPFLPGGTPMASSDKTAPARLFDARGVLVVPEGGLIPADAGDLYLDDGSQYGAAAPVKAAKKTAAGPDRETR